MNIRVTGQSGELAFPFRTSGPWIVFANQLIEDGFNILEENDLRDPDALVVNGISRNLNKFLNLTKVPDSKKVLVVWEPKVVKPKLYDNGFLSGFGLVLAPSPIWAKSVQGLSFNWPQDKFSDITEFDSWTKRINGPVMMQSNKFSAIKGEMYSLRRSIIAHLDSKNFAIYGPHWNRGYLYDSVHWLRSALSSDPRDFSLKSSRTMGGKYVSYKGTADNKEDVYRNFRIAIVVENSLDFVSEKLFDAVNRDCLVVYVGPNLKKFAIPEEGIQVVEASTNSVIRKVNELQSLSANEQYEIVLAQKRSLSSVINNFENYSVLKNLAITISQFLRAKI